jgi:hypothetical protein
MNVVKYTSASAWRRCKCSKWMDSERIDHTPGKTARSKRTLIFRRLIENEIPELAGIEIAAPQREPGLIREEIALKLRDSGIQFKEGPRQILIAR